MGVQLFIVITTFHQIMNLSWMQLFREMTGLHQIFRRPFVKRFTLCYQTIVCPICDLGVLCGQTVGLIQMKFGIAVGLGTDHNVLDGDPAPLPQRAQPQIFGPCLLWPNCWMDQVAT